MRPEALEERIARILRQRFRCTNATSVSTAGDIVAELRETHRIEPKGTPITPKDVRKGDRIRTEWVGGDVTESTISGPISGEFRRKLFLLNRADSDAGFVVPSRDGAVLRVTPRGFADDARTVASRENGVWHIAGIETTCSDDELPEFYGNFELLSDGSNQ